MLVKKVSKLSVKKFINQNKSKNILNKFSPRLKVCTVFSIDILLFQLMYNKLC